MDSFIDISAEEAEEARQYVSTHGVKEIACFLKTKVDEWKHVTLNFAVTGESGSGKSSFINTSRDLKPGDVGAAEVGVTETTMEPIKYPRPDAENVCFWDLPGVGTPNWPKETYLERVGYAKKDFFFIVTKSRFKQNDLWLASEVKRLGKNFCFIRTQVDFDLRNEQDDHPDTFCEETILKKMRDDIAKNLKAEGLEECPIFLIDNRKPLKWDFPALKDYIIAVLPSVKKQVMTFALAAISDGIIEKKMAELGSRVWKVAAISAAAAAVPLPGFSIAADLALLSHEIWFYRQQFGLDDGSLQVVADAMGTTLPKMRQIIGDTWYFTNIEGLKAILLGFSELVAEFGVEEVAHWIPVVGQLIAASLSFGATVYILKRALRDMEACAKRALKIAVTKTVGDLEQKKTA